MKKTILKDDNGKYLEVDSREFLEHLNEYHKTGTSLHTQSGCAFTVNEEFRIGAVFLLLVLILVYRRFKLSRKREYLK